MCLDEADSEIVTDELRHQKQDENEWYQVYFVQINPSGVCVYNPWPTTRPKDTKISSECDVGWDNVIAALMVPSNMLYNLYIFWSNVESSSDNNFEWPNFPTGIHSVRLVITLIRV